MFSNVQYPKRHSSKPCCAEIVVETATYPSPYMYLHKPVGILECQPWCAFWPSTQDRSWRYNFMGAKSKLCEEAVVILNVFHGSLFGVTLPLPHKASLTGYADFLKDCLRVQHLLSVARQESNSSFCLPLKTDSRWGRKASTEPVHLRNQIQEVAFVSRPGNK